MRASKLSVAAATLLALEGLALIVVALVEVFGLSAGDASSLPSALALIALTVIGGVGLVCLGVAVLRGRSWGRSGGMVLQIIAVATAASALGVRPFPTMFVLGLAVPGLIGAILLFLVSQREGPRAHRGGDLGDGDTREGDARQGDAGEETAREPR
ncbi:hypothetical protein J2Y69_000966 [Microbacterium resistens]|uniref:Histidine kinase n=1 Tax=Microbacterium resistens TaxID=156977 RepID=A0ABU1S9V2_9MICO|nr:hypothetical protein [Microbacterium resistens]MDR6866374.1 hypothetical protein [Microbacterium resistens]